MARDKAKLDREFNKLINHMLTPKKTQSEVNRYKGAIMKKETFDMSVSGLNEGIDFACLLNESVKGTKTHFMDWVNGDVYYG